MEHIESCANNYLLLAKFLNIKIIFYKLISADILNVSKLIKVLKITFNLKLIFLTKKLTILKTDTIDDTIFNVILQMISWNTWNNEHYSVCISLY